MDLSSTIRRVTLQPPIWWRVASVVVLVPTVIGAASRRGPAIGIVAALVYGAIMLGTAFAPDRVSAWSRRHLVLDGSVLGPLAFLATAYFASWSLWVCLLVGLAGALIGALMGQRRQRQLPDDEFL